MIRLIAFLLGVDDLSGLDIRGVSVHCLPLGPWWFGLLLGGVGGGILCFAYLRMRGGVPARTRHVLLATRLLLLLLVLLCLLRPITTVEARRSIRGQVAVLLDNSQSMGIRDPQGQSRFRIAESVAKRILLGLGKTHGTKAYLFSEDVAPAELAGDAELPEPSGRRTDIAGALSRVRREMADEALDGIVLITDGANNHGLSPRVIGDRLGVPVFPVAIGAEPAGVDLRVRDVVTDPFPLRDDVVPVRVILDARGRQTAIQGEVSLKRHGRVLATGRFDLAEPPTEDASVCLEYVPDWKGGLDLVVEATADIADAVPQNNRRELRVSVCPNQIRVLMVDGRPRWEYGFLRRALHADPHVTIAAETKVGTELVYKQADPYTRFETTLFPRTLGEWSQFDVVVIGDIKRSTFSIPQLFDLEAFVTEQGGGLLLLGGPQTLGTQQHYARTPIEKVLPFTYTDASRQRDEPVWVRVVPDAASHPILCLDSDSVRNAALWAGLPALWGCWELGPIRPSAIPLAVAQGEPAQGTGSPILVAQRCGRGRCLVFAAETSWRWSLHARPPGAPETAPEDEPNCHVRFWGNVVRWLASETSNPEERTFIHADRSVYCEGDAVHLQTRVLDRDYRPSPAARVVAAISSGTEVTGNLEFAAQPGARGIYRASFRPDRAGTYSVTVESQIPQGTGEALQGRATTTVVVESQNLEFQDVTVHERLLKDLSIATHGALFRPEDATNVLAELRKSMPTRRDALEIDPWNAPMIWLLFAGLLLGEWIFRKVRGMA